MKQINLLFLLLALTFLGSCKSVKQGLTGQKSNNNDEFLVQKKNPLVVPPNFEELPMPQTEKKIDDSMTGQEFDISKLLSKDSTVLKKKK